MNEVIKQIQNRKSIRNFTGQIIKDEDLELILKTAQRCPTSVNGQQTSIVYTRDKNKIETIAKLCGGQKQVATADVFVLFVADFYRTDYAVKSAGKTQTVHKTAGCGILGAVDAGICLVTMQTIAESLGYGTTAIGAVRANPQELIELFNLPKYTFPIVGSTIGVPAKEALNAPLKPRVPFESFAFEDSYDKQKVKDGVDKYEEEFKKYRLDNNMNFKISYKETTAGFYSGGYTPKVLRTLISQGFDFEEGK